MPKETDFSSLHLPHQARSVSKESQTLHLLWEAGGTQAAWVDVKLAAQWVFKRPLRADWLVSGSQLVYSSPGRLISSSQHCLDSCSSWLRPPGLPCIHFSVSIVLVYIVLLVRL